MENAVGSEPQEHRNQNRRGEHSAEPEQLQARRCDRLSLIVRTLWHGRRIAVAAAHGHRTDNVPKRGAPSAAIGDNEPVFPVIEFQNQVANDPNGWESTIRFVLRDDRVELVARDDEPTQVEVAMLLDEIFDTTLLTPKDGGRFFEAIATWNDGTRFARMSHISEMSAQAAFSTDGLVPVDADADADGEAVVELMGHLQRDLATLLG